MSPEHKVVSHLDAISPTHNCHEDDFDVDTCSYEECFRIIEDFFPSYNSIHETQSPAIGTLQHSKSLDENKSSGNLLAAGGMLRKETDHATRPLDLIKADMGYIRGIDISGQRADCEFTAAVATDRKVDAIELPIDTLSNPRCKLVTTTPAQITDSASGVMGADDNKSTHFTKPVPERKGDVDSDGCGPLAPLHGGSKDADYPPTPMQATTDPYLPDIETSENLKDSLIPGSFALVITRDYVYATPPSDAEPENAPSSADVGISSLGDDAANTSNISEYNRMLSQLINKSGGTSTTTDSMVISTESTRGDDIQCAGIIEQTTDSPGEAYGINTGKSPRQLSGSPSVVRDDLLTLSTIAQENSGEMSEDKSPVSSVVVFDNINEHEHVESVDHVLNQPVDSITPKDSDTPDDASMPIGEDILCSQLTWHEEAKLHEQITSYEQAMSPQNNISHHDLTANISVQGLLSTDSLQKEGQHDHAFVDIADHVHLEQHTDPQVVGETNSTGEPSPWGCLPLRDIAAGYYDTALTTPANDTQCGASFDKTLDESELDLKEDSGPIQSLIQDISAVYIFDKPATDGVLKRPLARVESEASRDYEPAAKRTKIDQAFQHDKTSAGPTAEVMDSGEGVYGEEAPISAAEIHVKIEAADQLKVNQSTSIVPVASHGDVENRILESHPDDVAVLKLDTPADTRLAGLLDEESKTMDMEVLKTHHLNTSLSLVPHSFHGPYVQAANEDVQERVATISVSPTPLTETTDGLSVQHLDLADVELRDYATIAAQPPPLTDSRPLLSGPRAQTSDMKMQECITNASDSPVMVPFTPPSHTSVGPIDLQVQSSGANVQECFISSLTSPTLSTPPPGQNNPSSNHECDSETIFSESDVPECPNAGVADPTVPTPLSAAAPRNIESEVPYENEKPLDGTAIASIKPRLEVETSSNIPTDHPELHVTTPDVDMQDRTAAMLLPTSSEMKTLISATATLEQEPESNQRILVAKMQECVSSDEAASIPASDLHAEFAESDVKSFHTIAEVQQPAMSIVVKVPPTLEPPTPDTISCKTSPSARLPQMEPRQHSAAASEHNHLMYSPPSPTDPADQTEAHVQSSDMGSEDESVIFVSTSSRSATFISCPNVGAEYSEHKSVDAMTEDYSSADSAILTLKRALPSQLPVQSPDAQLQEHISSTVRARSCSPVLSPAGPMIELRRIRLSSEPLVSLGCDQAARKECAAPEPLDLRHTQAELKKEKDTENVSEEVDSVETTGSESVFWDAKVADTTPAETESAQFDAGSSQAEDSPAQPLKFEPSYCNVKGAEAGPETEPAEVQTSDDVAEFASSEVGLEVGLEEVEPMQAEPIEVQLMNSIPCEAEPAKSDLVEIDAVQQESAQANSQEPDLTGFETAEHILTTTSAPNSDFAQLEPAEISSVEVSSQSPEPASSSLSSTEVTLLSQSNSSAHQTALFHKTSTSHASCLDPPSLQPQPIPPLPPTSPPPNTHPHPQPPSPAEPAPMSPHQPSPTTTYRASPPHHEAEFSYGRRTTRSETKLSDRASAEAAATSARTGGVRQNGEAIDEVVETVPVVKEEEEDGGARPRRRGKAVGETKGRRKQDARGAASSEGGVGLSRTKKGIAAGRVAKSNAKGKGKMPVNPEAASTNTVTDTRSPTTPTKAKAKSKSNNAKTRRTAAKTITGKGAGSVPRSTRATTAAASTLQPKLNLAASPSNTARPIPSTRSTTSPSQDSVPHLPRSRPTTRASSRRNTPIAASIPAFTSTHALNLISAPAPPPASSSSSSSSYLAPIPAPKPTPLPSAGPTTRTLRPRGNTPVTLGAGAAARRPERRPAGAGVDADVVAGVDADTTTVGERGKVGRTDVDAEVETNAEAEIPQASGNRHKEEEEEREHEQGDNKVIQGDSTGGAGNARRVVVQVLGKRKRGV